MVAPITVGAKLLQKLRPMRNIFLALLGVLMAGSLGSAHADPLPAVDPAGEQFLEAVLVNDAVTDYSGGQSLLSWGSKPILAVTARAYFADYQSNQIAADQKYQNKAIAISGTIDSVNNDQLNGPYVSFTVDGLGNWVYAYLDPSAMSEAASYNAGQTVTLFCVSAGILVEIPQLKQCVGKQTLTVVLHQEIHGALESWLTGGPFPYGDDVKTKGIFLLVYEGGKTLNPDDPSSDPSQIMSDQQRFTRIFQLAVKNPDTKADAAFVGLPLKSSHGPQVSTGSP
ncbi:MAG: hypothetical protein POH28_04010 [Acidocella sp.]|nr:hypothetical protein [Acidocella sp.]